MKNFLLLAALILSFAFDANAAPGAGVRGTPQQLTPQRATNTSVDTTSSVMCSIIKYTQDLGGPMITIVIIGAALLAIFGKMPWPALFALGAFTAVFFGAPAVVRAITGQDGCCPAGKTWNQTTKTCT